MMHDTAPKSKNIYIIRHGQTDFNVRQVVQGRGVNSDLNDTGIQQAKLFFEAHKEIKFDVVYTSSLKRTWQTVDAFISKKIPHIAIDSLDEIDWGIFEGVEHHPDLQKTYYDIINEWKNGNLAVKIEGGESAQDLSDRLQPFLNELKNTQEQTILVCTHGRTLRAVFLLAIPMILELSLESVFAVVDIFFVSKLGENAIATVGLTESAITIVYSIAIGLSTGATAIVARRIGEKNPEAA